MYKWQCWCIYDSTNFFGCINFSRQQLFANNTFTVNLLVVKMAASQIFTESKKEALLNRLWGYKDLESMNIMILVLFSRYVLYVNACLLQAKQSVSWGSVIISPIYYKLIIAYKIKYSRRKVVLLSHWS